MAKKKKLIHVHDPAVGSNVCLKGIGCIQRLGVESTLFTVCEGHATDVLVVSTTGGPVKVKHGLLLGKCLAL